MYFFSFATYKEGPGVAGSTFDGVWGTRRWWDVDRGTEDEEWAVSVGEDGNVVVHGDVTWDRSGRLYYGWNFSWDECRVWDEEDREVGEVMSLVQLMIYDQKLSWAVGKTPRVRVAMQVMFEILVEQMKN